MVIHSRLCTTSYAFVTLWSLFFIHVCKISHTIQSEYEPSLILLFRDYLTSFERPKLLVGADSTFTPEAVRCGTDKLVRRISLILDVVTPRATL
jgi:hypothetical protein